MAPSLHKYPRLFQEVFRQARSCSSVASDFHREAIPILAERTSRTGMPFFAAPRKVAVDLIVLQYCSKLFAVDCQRHSKQVSLLLSGTQLQFVGAVHGQDGEVLYSLSSHSKSSRSFQQYLNPSVPIQHSTRGIAVVTNQHTLEKLYADNMDPKGHQGGTKSRADSLEPSAPSTIAANSSYHV